MALKKSSKKKGPYHHGNLREALIVAGLAIVEVEGVDAVSLRAVARRARVSHSAPYHHFSSKAELLAALAAAGFDRLVAVIANEIERSSSPAPLDQLSALGQAYMHFGAENPSIFRLMFRPELTQPDQHPLLKDAEARAFGTLMRIICAAQQIGALPPSDPLELAAFAWSGVHSLATLKVEQVLHETPLGAYDWKQVVHFVDQKIVAGLTAGWKRNSR